MKISQLLDENLVLFLDSKTRDEALREMVEQLSSQDILRDKETFFEAIVSREDIVSTGIGMGVAIPHAKLPGYNDFFIAVGILGSGVDWDALDGAPVRIIFLIGGPDDKQTEYLQILSSLTAAIKNEERRKKMLTLNSVDGIIKLFEKL